MDAVTKYNFVYTWKKYSQIPSTKKNEDLDRKVETCLKIKTRGDAENTQPDTWSALFLGHLTPFLSNSSESSFFFKARTSQTLFPH